MPSVFNVLSREHEQVKRMLSELEVGPTAATGANADQLALRKKIVQQLVTEQSRHERAEEMYFWPVVLERLPDGADLANQGQQQEQEGKALLDQLGQLEPEAEEFETGLARFIRVGRDHIAFEEEAVWPGLRAALTAQEADNLGHLLEDGAR